MTSITKISASTGGLEGGVRAWKFAPDAPPLFVEPTSSALRDVSAFVAWTKANRKALDDLLIEHGGIVFRGFPVETAEHFDAFASNFEPYAGDYKGGASPRLNITGRVYEATQLAGPLKIELHQEMAYIEDAPGRIVFYCRKPAERGGETIIGDMRRVTRNLPEDLARKIKQKGVLGVRNFAPTPVDGVEMAEDHPDQRSWNFSFYTDDKAEVEESCRAKDIEPIWNEDGSLTVRARTTAYTAHPKTGEMIYRSNLHSNGGREMAAALPEFQRKRVEEMFARQKIKTGFYLGDGTPLTPEELRQLIDVFDEAEISWDWQAGDIMLLDNLLVAHGRNPFEGTRDVQVALLA